MLSSGGDAGRALPQLTTLPLLPLHPQQGLKKSYDYKKVLKALKKGAQRRRDGPSEGGREA